MEEESNGVLHKVPGAAIGEGSQKLPRPAWGQPEVLKADVDGGGKRGWFRVSYRLAHYPHGKSSTWAWTPFHAEAIDPP